MFANATGIVTVAILFFKMAANSFLNK